MKQTPVNIMIVDDHEVVISGITKLLDDNEQYRIKGTAQTSGQVEEILDHHHVDIAIIDLSLPEFEGVELHNTIKKSSPQTKTIVFSMHESGWVINQLVMNGVDGYVSKTTDFQELKTAIDEVLQGNTYFCSKTKEKYPSFFDIQSLQNNSLTKREKDIVKLIFQEYKTTQIAKKLKLSKNTVESHRKNIMQKFEVKNSVGIIKKAIERGIINI